MARPRRKSQPSSPSRGTSAKVLTDHAAGASSSPSEGNSLWHRAPIPLAALLAAAVGVVDYFTGWEMSFALFYLAPVAVATWFAGRRAGMIFCGLCAAGVAAIQMGGDRSISHIAWNAGIDLGIFLMVSALLAGIKSGGLRFRLPAAHRGRVWAVRGAACLLGGGVLLACWGIASGDRLSAKEASTCLAKMEGDLEACLRLSRPVLLGSRDPKGASCVPVIKTGDVRDRVPDSVGDLDGGPGTRLSTLTSGPVPRARTAMQDYAWHQGRLKTVLENLSAVNKEPLRLSGELAREAERFSRRLQRWTALPESFKPAASAGRGDWPSYCLASLSKAAAGGDLAAVQRWAAEFASASFALEDLHRWLAFLTENNLTALEFQARCESLFAWADGRLPDYEPRRDLSAFPAGLLTMHGTENYKELERQAERLFHVPADRLAELAENKHLTAGSVWMPPAARQLFLKLQEPLSPANRKTWEQAARTPYEHSYLVNMLYRALRSESAEQLREVLQRFNANHPEASMAELMGVLMYRGHSFGGVEWGDRFQPRVMEAAATMRGSDEEAFVAAHNYTYGFYRLAEYSVTLTLRQAIEQGRIDCVRATDMIGDILRNSGRARFAHVRWSAGTAAHSVAALVTTQNDRTRILLLDGMMPSDKPEVWPEAYYRGHAWPTVLADNPPPYAVELYVRGLDNYIWAEGYIIRDSGAGTLMKAALPYLPRRERKICQKVFQDAGSAPASSAN